MGLRRLHGTVGAPERVGARIDHEEQRRAAAERPFAQATLCCPDCDVPLVLPEGRVALGATLSCGFCARTGPLRDFLSLRSPKRPTRVSLWVSPRSPR